MRYISTPMRIVSIKKHPLLGPILMAALFLNLEKQFFFCCTLSESVAEKIQEYFECSSTLSANHHETHHSIPLAMNDISQDAIGLQTEFESHSPLSYQTSDSCLSENSESEFMILGIHFEVVLTNATDFRVAQLPRPVSQIAYAPRPQNKSSPPISLATIRIQV